MADSEQSINTQSDAGRSTLAFTPQDICLTPRGLAGIADLAVSSWRVARDGPTGVAGLRSSWGLHSCSPTQRESSTRQPARGGSLDLAAPLHPILVQILAMGKAQPGDAWFELRSGYVCRGHERWFETWNELAKHLEQAQGHWWYEGKHVINLQKIIICACVV